MTTVKKIYQYTPNNVTPLPPTNPNSWAFLKVYICMFVFYTLIEVWGHIWSQNDNWMLHVCIYTWVQINLMIKQKVASLVIQMGVFEKINEFFNCLNFHVYLLICCHIFLHIFDIFEKHFILWRWRFGLLHLLQS